MGKIRTLIFDNPNATAPDTQIIWQSNAGEYYEGVGLIVPKTSIEECRSIDKNEFIIDYLDDDKYDAVAEFTNYPDPIMAKFDLPRPTDIYLQYMGTGANSTPRQNLVKNLFAVSVQQLRRDGFEYLYTHFDKKRNLQSIGFEKIPNPISEYYGLHLNGISLDAPRLKSFRPFPVNREYTDIIDNGLT